MTALNPVYTIGFQIAEMLRTHQAMAPKAARARAIELLKLVEIPDPRAAGRRLSAPAVRRSTTARDDRPVTGPGPRLLIADEPTTALDVTVQAEILKLMRDLKDRIDASIILITHDMGVVADMADRILVMKDGVIVERGDAEEIFHRPMQPYTIQLLDAVPHLGSVVAREAACESAAEDPRPSRASRIGAARSTDRYTSEASNVQRESPANAGQGPSRHHQAGRTAPGVAGRGRPARQSRSSIRATAARRRSGRWTGSTSRSGAARWSGWSGESGLGQDDDRPGHGRLASVRRAARATWWAPTWSTAKGKELRNGPDRPSASSSRTRARR